MDISGLSNLRSIGAESQKTTPLSQMVINNQIKFPESKQEMRLYVQLDKSKLDDRIPNKATLNKLGFNVPFPATKVGNIELPEQEYLLDMNGGKTYQNKNGDTIRIFQFDAELATGMTGATGVEYKSKDGNMRHQMYYDPEGNPIKGSMTVENEDGSIENFTYEYDLDGNRHVTSYQKSVRN